MTTARQLRRTATMLAVATVTIAPLVGCSVAARSPETYRDDTKAALESKSDAIRACYDGVLKTTPGAQGRVAVDFEVETEHGKITNVTVDKSKTTAPDPLVQCVTGNIQGVALQPPDERKGVGSWVYDFAPPPAPAASATAPS